MALLFRTPDNEKSFSGLIDAAVLATGKPGSLVSITQFANAVVRECQALGLFARDLIEDGLTVPSNNQTGSITWDRPVLFRSLRSVKYKTSCEYPKLALPGRKQRDLLYYYYAADSYFVFNGVSPNEVIAYATYYWQKRLGYYGALDVNTAQVSGGPYTIRPAYYDSNEDKWQYLNTAEDAYVDTTGDPVVDVARQALVTNWLVSDWYDLILSGTKAKMFTSGGDPRAGAEYSNYKQLQKVMQNTVGYESEDY